MLPTFLGFGVQRAASTWLHNCLSEHPDVFVPEKKEIHFFNAHYENGIGWYERHFDSQTGETAVGEITPSYLHAAPIARVRDCLPDVRLIVILRDPVDRAFSAYRLLNRQFDGMTFEEACNSSRGAYLTNLSLYAERLREVYDLYPRQQVGVFLYDEVSSEPDRVLAEIFRFIGVDCTFRPASLQTRPNRIIFPKLTRFIERAGMGWSLSLVKASPAGDMIREWSRRKEQTKVEDHKFRNELRARFVDDIDALEKLLQRDLSIWRR